MSGAASKVGVSKVGNFNRLLAINKNTSRKLGDLIKKEQSPLTVKADPGLVIITVQSEESQEVCMFDDNLTNHPSRLSTTAVSDSSESSNHSRRSTCVASDVSDISDQGDGNDVVSVTETHDTSKPFRRQSTEYVQSSFQPSATQFKSASRSFSCVSLNREVTEIIALHKIPRPRPIVTSKIRVDLVEQYQLFLQSDLYKQEKTNNESQQFKQWLLKIPGFEKCSEEVLNQISSLQMIYEIKFYLICTDIKNGLMHVSIRQNGYYKTIFQMYFRDKNGFFLSASNPKDAFRGKPKKQDIMDAIKLYRDNKVTDESNLVVPTIILEDITKICELRDQDIAKYEACIERQNNFWKQQMSILYFVFLFLIDRFSELEGKMPDKMKLPDFRLNKLNELESMAEKIFNKKFEENFPLDNSVTNEEKTFHKEIHKLLADSKFWNKLWLYCQNCVKINEADRNGLLTAKKFFAA